MSQTGKVHGQVLYTPMTRRYLADHLLKNASEKGKMSRNKQFP